MLLIKLRKIITLQVGSFTVLNLYLILISKLKSQKKFSPQGYKYVIYLLMNPDDIFPIGF